MSGVTEPTGRIHSVQSLGAADGPGVRAVVFMQGCPLRCTCCHNPDTWNFSGGRDAKAEELCTQLLRFAPYFGTDGGVTVSGGEPLCQADFVRRLFVRLHENGIHTALDTSGCLLTPAADALLAETDLVLLDWKYTDDAAYRRYVGCGQAQVAAFLQRLQERQIPVWLRQVSIVLIAVVTAAYLIGASSVDRFMHVIAVGRRQPGQLAAARQLRQPGRAGPIIKE